MPVYQIKAPTGKIYDIKGPEGATDAELFAAANQYMLEDQEADYYKKDPGIAENVLSGLGSGFTGTLESGALGIAALLDEEKELAAREVIQSLGDKFTPDGGDKDSISYGLANAFGSIAGFAAPAVAAAVAAPAAIPAGVMGTGVAAALGMATQAGEASERARDAGATEDERNQAIRYTTPVGLTEVLPLGKVFKGLTVALPSGVKVPLFHDLLAQIGPTKLKGIRGRIASAAQTGGLEAAQEVTQELVQNMAEQGIYNPSKELMDNLGPAAGYGGGAGAIMQGMVDLFAGKRFRKARADANEEAENKETDDLVDQLDMFDEGSFDSPVADAAQGDMFGYDGPIAPPVAEANPDQGDIFNPEVDIPAGSLMRQMGLIDEPDVTKEGELDFETAPSGAQPDLFNAPSTVGEMSEEDKLNQLLEDPVIFADTVARLKKSKEDAAQPPSTQLDIESEIGRLQATEADQQTAVAEQVGLAKQAADMEQASGIESADARVQDRQQKQTAAVRTALLDNVIGNNKSQNYIAVAKDFKNKLTAANLRDVEPTNEELVKIQRAVNIQFAEADVAPEVQPTPPTGNQSELESLVSEKLPKDTQPEQLTLPEVEGKNRAGKKYPTQTVASEQQAAAEPISPDKLTELGVAKAAPMRGRVAQDPTNLALVKQELTDYANNTKVPEQTKFKITKYLEGEVADQIEAFGPRGAVVAPAKRATKNEPTTATDQTGSRDSTANTAPNTVKEAATSPKQPSATKIKKPVVGSVGVSTGSDGTTGDGTGGGDVAVDTAPTTEQAPVGVSATERQYKGWVIDKADGEGDWLMRPVGEENWTDSAASVAEAKRMVTRFKAEEVEAKAEHQTDMAEVDSNRKKKAEKTQTESIVDAIKEGFAGLQEAQEPTESKPKTKPKTAKQKRADSQADLLEKGTKKFGSGNRFVTQEMFDKAMDDRNTTKSLGPAELVNAAIIAGFYIEGGARSFIDYNTKMVEAFGERITKKQLNKIYSDIRDEGNIDGMDSKAALEGKREPLTTEQQAELDAMTDAQKDKARVSGDSRSAEARDIANKAYIDENPKELATISDYKTVLNLLEKEPNPKSEKMAYAAYTYFNDGRRIIDNLTDIAYDASHGLELGGRSNIKVSKYNKPAITDIVSGLAEPDTVQDNAFSEQKGGAAADLTMQWVRKNLGKEANAEFSKKLTMYFESYIQVLGLDPVTYRSESEQRTYNKTDEGKEEIAKKKAIEAEKEAAAIYAEAALVSDIAASDFNQITDQQAIADFEKSEAQAEIEDKMAADAANTSAKEQEDAAVEANRGVSEEVVKHFDGLIDLMEDAGNVLGLPYFAIDSTSLPMPPQVRSLIAAGDLQGALELVAQTAPNEMVRRVASAIGKNIGNTKIEMVKGLKNDAGKAAGGHFNPKTNTIHINADQSVPVHVLLHESAHAVLSDAIENNKSHPSVKQLQTLYNSVKGELSSHYGTESLQEFVAEALSNPQFQQELASLFATKKTNKTAFQQFIESFLSFFRQKFSIAPTPAIGTQQQLTDMLLNLMAPAPASRNAAVMHSQGLMGLQERAEALVNSVKYGTELSEAAKPRITKKDFIAIAKKLFFTDLPSKARLAASGLFPAYQLADITTGLGVHGSHAVYHAFNHFEEAIDFLNAKTDSFTNQFDEWRGKVATPEQVMAFDYIRAWSTREGVHPAKKSSEYKGRKLEQWKAMQDTWKLLGKEGQEQYEGMRNQYVKAYERLKENLLGAIEESTESIKDPDEKAEMRQSLRGQIFKDLLEGTDIDPYFPLWRKGNYWVQYAASLDGQNETIYEIFQTPDEQSARYAELKDISKSKSNPAKVVDVVQYETSDFKDFNKVPPTQFVKDSMDILNKMEVDEKTKEMFVQLFIDRLPETSFAKKVQARTGDYGFEMDSLETFRNTIYDLNRQTAQLKHGRLIRKAFGELTDNFTLAINEHGEDQRKRAALVDLKYEWKMRADFAVNPDSDWKATLARNTNRFAFTGTIGFSPSSALVNLSQIPMVVYPYLAGKTNLKTAYRSLNTARHLLANAGKEHQIQIEGKDGKLITHKSFAPSIDNYFVANADTGKLSVKADFDLTKEAREQLEEILPMVQFMKDNAQLARSLYYDTLGVELSGKGKNIFDKATAWSAYMFHITERTNRQIAMVGAYLNELERLKTNPDKKLLDADGKQVEVGLSEEEMRKLAVKNGFKDAQYTNGGSVLATAPRWAQKNIGRVAMMFKSYGVGMYIMQGTLMKRMWDNRGGKNEYEYRQAKAQFWGIQGTVALMSGLQGVTMYGIAAMIANMFFLDDEDDSFQTMTRKVLGEGIYKGGLNQVTRVLGGEGVDIAARIGLSNLLIADGRYNFDPSPEKSLVKTLGGPAYGYGSQIGRGVADMFDGEWRRGIENVMPAAFRNVLKAFRYYQEGEIRSRRGDPIMGNLEGVLLGAQVLGFAPAEYTMNQEAAQEGKGKDRPVGERRTKLMWLMYRAERFGDDVDWIWDDIDEFNDKYPNNAIDGKALNASRKKHMATDDKMVNGVLYSPKMYDELVEDREEWDQGLQLFN